MSGRYSLAFGSLPEGPAPTPRAPRRVRIALFADLGARREIETGAALAARRPRLLDIDTLDEVIAAGRTTLALPIGDEGASVAVPLASLDDLHPDAVYQAVGLFDDLARLRRRVAGGDTEAAVAALRAWGDAFAEALAPPAAADPGTAVPLDAGLSDFERLIGEAIPDMAATAPPGGEDALDRLLGQIVGPHVVAAEDPRQATMLAAVDAAIADAMRRVLHHPAFQAIESTWRALETVARRVETDETVEIVVYDITAAEWAADLSGAEDLSETGLYRLLVEAPARDGGPGPVSAVFALYTLDESPVHAALLARMARIAARAGAPFVTALSARALARPAETRAAVIEETWAALRALPDAAYLGLVAPRWLARLPYGKGSDPIERFAFQELGADQGPEALLWANPAALAAVLFAGCAAAGEGVPDLTAVLEVGDMPYHTVTDRYGSVAALPCTERPLTHDEALATLGRGVMPLLAIRGRTDVRLGGFQSLAGTPLAGAWHRVAAGEGGALGPAVPDPAALGAALAALAAHDEDFTGPDALERLISRG
ncbi:MAG: type VI secretion system contractile sheath large subunit [Pseudomonadota bacterium]